MHLNQKIVNLSTPSAERPWFTFGLSRGRGLKVDPEGALKTHLKGSVLYSRRVNI